MLATALVIFAAIYLFVGLMALAPRKAGFSHIRRTISEIGEIGAPDQRLAAVGLFLPIGVALLLVAFLIRSAAPVAAELAFCIAMGYIGAAAFPSDPRTPLFGTMRQGVHNRAGAVQYVGGAYALTTLAEHFGPYFKFAGFIVLGTAVALSVLSADSFRGFVQRIAEVCLFGGLVLVVWPR